MREKFANAAKLVVGLRGGFCTQYQDLPYTAHREGIQIYFFRILSYSLACFKGSQEPARRTKWFS